MAKDKQGSLDTVSCRLTVYDAIARRNTEVALVNHQLALRAIKDGADEEDARVDRVLAIESLMRLIAQFCTGTVSGHDISTLDGVAQLSDAQILELGKGMVRLSEDEEKKSETSSVDLPKVVSAE